MSKQCCSRGMAFGAVKETDINVFVLVWCWLNHSSLAWTLCLWFFCVACMFVSGQQQGAWWRVAKAWPGGWRLVCGLVGWFVSFGTRSYNLMRRSQGPRGVELRVLWEVTDCVFGLFNQSHGHLKSIKEGTTASLPLGSFTDFHLFSYSQ